MPERPSFVFFDRKTIQENEVILGSLLGEEVGKYYSDLMVGYTEYFPFGCIINDFNGGGITSATFCLGEPALEGGSVFVTITSDSFNVGFPRFRPAPFKSPLSIPPKEMFPVNKGILPFYLREKGHVVLCRKRVISPKDCRDFVYAKILDIWLKDKDLRVVRFVSGMDGNEEYFKKVVEESAVDVLPVSKHEEARDVLNALMLEMQDNGGGSAKIKTFRGRVVLVSVEVDDKEKAFVFRDGQMFEDEIGEPWKKK